jgi:hypothetical protein
VDQSDPSGLAPAFGFEVGAVGYCAFSLRPSDRSLLSEPGDLSQIGWIGDGGGAGEGAWERPSPDEILEQDEAASEEAEPEPPLRPGPLARVIDSPAGRVRVEGEVETEGKTMTVKGLLVYPENSPGRINAGVGVLKAAADNLATEAAAQGYDSLRLEFYRTGGANPGTYRSIPINLARYR